MASASSCKHLLLLVSLLSFVSIFPALLLAASPFPYHKLNATTASPSMTAATGTLSSSERFVGASELVHLRYHMGPVLSSPINLYVLWYGPWTPAMQAPIKDFLLSLSDPSIPSPSAAQWWSTLALYSDQTGANVSRQLSIAGEAFLPDLPLGASLSRLDIQLVIADALAAGSLPVDHRRGAYLVLTATGVSVQDFCRAVCGFHYFTFPSLVSHTLPYAWVGHSGA